MHQLCSQLGKPLKPITHPLRADLDSRLADLANVTGHRWGGMLAAGIFLREFVADSLDWVHIDIAGPSFNTGSPWGYTGKGGTGVPTRTMFAVLRSDPFAGFGVICDTVPWPGDDRAG